MFPGKETVLQYGRAVLVLRIPVLVKGGGTAGGEATGLPLESVLVDETAAVARAG